ncbi:MAG: hypothetical protein ABIH23_15505, partial [bacterium]
MAETQSLQEIVGQFFRAKTRFLPGWNAVAFSTWTPLERYVVTIYPPGRKGRPSTDDKWMLRVDARNDGTGFYYADAPESLLRYAREKLCQERRLDRALHNAYRSGDEQKIRALELERFLHYPLA